MGGSGATSDERVRYPLYLANGFEEELDQLYKQETADAS